MLFNSISFALFYIIVTSLYFILPHKYRWVLLLLASCYFYMDFVPVYILILGFTIMVDYFAGIFISQNKGRHRKTVLIISLVSNIGILMFFKYFNFLNTNLSVLLNNFNYHNPIPYLSILLPVGLSFHTFQAMSYNIEVYRGNQTAEKHFGIYSLYVMFYPQLVAGPIERPQNLLHQFREKHKFNYDQITSGLKLMAWGLFKKVVIADRLAIFVNLIYDDPQRADNLSLLIATIFFAFQIFCDFSGYTDIAIGAARTMGFTLMKNFNSPYHARSIEGFWKRWHISLSSWFRDYLYIPLGGNRVMISRWYLNLMIIFLISGVWHGANWTFIVWGALHGFYLIFGLATKRFRNRWATWLGLNKLPFLSVIVTFTLVSFAWIFFRSADLHTAIYISKRLLTGIPDMFRNMIHAHLTTGYNRISLVISISLIVMLEVVHFVQNKIDLNKFLKRSPYIRWATYYLLVIAILLFGIFNHSQFIYFQF